MRERERERERERQRQRQREGDVKNISLYLNTLELSRSLQPSGRSNCHLEVMLSRENALMQLALTAFTRLER